MNTQEKQAHRIRRKIRIRKKIYGTETCPRLSVYRSLTKITAQLIDDNSGRTLVFVASEKKGMQFAYEAGKKLAEEAGKNNIETCVFDRNGFTFQGMVASLAKGAREGGLKF